jgi:hypothetical protein
MSPRDHTGKSGVGSRLSDIFPVLHTAYDYDERF